HVRPARDAPGDGDAGAHRSNCGAWYTGGARRWWNAGPAAAWRHRPLRRTGSSVARPVRDRVPAVARAVRRPRLPCGDRDRERRHARPQLDRLVWIAKAEGERPCDWPHRRGRILRAIDPLACQAWMRARMTHFVE